MTKGLFIALLFISIHSFAQTSPIVSGPMIGHTELRSSVIWVETIKPKGWSIKYSEENKTGKSVNNPIAVPVNDYYILKFMIGGLKPGTVYQYNLFLKNKIIASGSFTTQPLWQWRMPAPDFSFITGSCAYINEPVYDRPGKPYGLDSSIFEARLKRKQTSCFGLVITGTQGSRLLQRMGSQLQTIQGQKSESVAAISRINASLCYMG